MKEDKIQKKLDKLIDGKKSNWRETFADRKKNSVWTRYAKLITVKILYYQLDNELSNKQLAELLGVTPQRVTTILKGKENFTLETIGNIESKLGISLIEVKPSKDKVLENDIDLQKNQPSLKSKTTNEGEVVEYDVTNSLSEVAEEGAEYNPE